MDGAGGNEIWGWGETARTLPPKPPKWWERQVMRFSRFVRTRWSVMRERRHERGRPD
jgi:hypothetical protein